LNPTSINTRQSQKKHLTPESAKLHNKKAYVDELRQQIIEKKIRDEKERKKLQEIERLEEERVKREVEELNK
jgi:hypothetical protein